MQTSDCKITAQDAITESVFRIRLSAPGISKLCSPGQFVHMRVSTGLDPLLRRPFSIHRAHESAGEIELLYRVVGSGTATLRDLKPGDVVNLMGPLGNGFDLEKPVDHAVVVAGGMGGAPVFYLIDALLKRNKRVTLLWGTRDGREIFDEADFEARGVALKIATEDASKGHNGLVTDLLKTFLAQHAGSAGLGGYVCGPEPMIRAVQDIVRSTDFLWQASLEEQMACGVGVCLGCAVKLKTGEIQMVCKDGPVFDIREIAFNG
ncbi:dihydroorotate dehydrogenase electron transfer subunit [bacterium]|nr:dihydroorotate dehydrogenase electron transfer subunit [bacterium]